MRDRDTPGDAEGAALHLEHFPEHAIVLVQAEERSGGLFHVAGCEEVIKMGVSVQNHRHGQSERLNLPEDPVRRSPGIHNYGLFGQGIADDRTIAAERGHGKGFANESCHREAVRQSC